MKATLSTLISSKNITLHSSSLCRSIYLHPKPLFPLRAFLSPIAPFKVITTNIRIGLSRKSQTRYANFSSVMASAYKLEEARVPPALPLPTPPVTKFKIALCQLSVMPDKERNISHAQKAIADSNTKGRKKIQTACDVMLMPV